MARKKKTVSKSRKAVSFRKKRSANPVGKPSRKKTSVRSASAKFHREAGVKVSRKRPTGKDLDTFRSLLLEMRESLTSQINHLKGDSLVRNDSVVSEEDGTDTFERQFALGIVSTDNDAVFEIDEALRRIDEKKYGLCEGCGMSIEPMRLKALPFVRLCIKCQSEKESKGLRGSDSDRRRW